MQKDKPKRCQATNCSNEFKPFRSTDKYCSLDCAIEMQKEPKKDTKRRRIIRKQPVKPVSGKQKILLAKYHKQRLVFLSKPENKKCPVFSLPTTEIHHKQGRKGYADDWARENNVPLLLDERFWLAVSRTGHRKIEENPTWAKREGFSVSRVQILPL